MTIAEHARAILAFAYLSIRDLKVYATEQTVERRLAICLACPSKRERGGKLHCRTCGCQFRRKLVAYAASCPLGRWGPEVAP